MLLNNYEFAEKLVGPEKPVKSVSVYRAAHNRDLFLAYAQFGRCCHQVASAVGYDYGETRMKAIVEAYERYVSTHTPAHAFTARASSLEVTYLSPETFLPLSDSQKASVGLRKFDRARKYVWVSGHDLASNVEVVIPADAVYYDLNIPRNRLAFSNSSGIAAHTDFDVALRKAVEELVERDALMRFWVYREAKPVHNVAIVEASRRNLWTLGRDMNVYQLPSEFGEVYLAAIRGDVWPFFVSGAAATVSGDSLEAISHAVAEAEGNLVAYSNCEHKELKPEEVWTPSDHGLFYCQKEHADLLKLSTVDEVEAHSWPDEEKLEALYNALSLKYVQLDGPESDIFVVRTFSRWLVPITFGTRLFPKEHIAFTPNRGLVKSRMSNPHFFA